MYILVQDVVLRVRPCTHIALHILLWYLFQCIFVYILCNSMLNYMILALGSALGKFFLAHISIVCHNVYMYIPVGKFLWWKTNPSVTNWFTSSNISDQYNGQRMFSFQVPWTTSLSTLIRMWPWFPPPLSPPPCPSGCTLLTSTQVGINTTHRNILTAFRWSNINICTFI